MNRERNHRKEKRGHPSKLYIRAVLIVMVTIAMLTAFVIVWNPFAYVGRQFQSDQWVQNDEKFLATSVPLSTITPMALDYSPKSAWVDTGVLTVQMWPGKGYPALAEVVRGQEVRIIRESDDGEWSLLDHPMKGWVRTEYLRHIEKYLSPRLTPASFRSYRWVKADPRLRVRSDPDAGSDIITHIAHGELVEIDQFTDDMRWAHIIAPVEGWTSIRYLSLTPTNE